LAGWGVDAEPMLETGCVLLSNQHPNTRSEGEPLRICWSGLFQGIKALPILLRAMATFDRKDALLLDVLGEGPESELWKKLAEEIGIEDRVRWWGMLPRDRALDIMRKSHVFVHSSVKEGTPHVVLEALSMGLPVICHDACGMGTAVTESCGFKVALHDPGTSVEGFTAALKKLHDDPLILSKLSRGALVRACELTWESKILRLSEAYRSAVAPP
jgi:glycosyltransferase involved in cell wall biosynthesis